MKHRFLVALLAFGTVAGFGAGFFHMGMHAHGRRDAFERHIADVCTDSALRAQRGSGLDRRDDRDHFDRHQAHDRFGDDP